MSVGVNLQTFVCDSIGDGTVDNMMAAITENLSCRSLHMQARAVNNSYGAVKVSQHGLPPHLCESQGLNVHAPNQS